MEDTDVMASPILELRRLYRDAQAKSARLRLIVDVRIVLDREPFDTSITAALSVIAGFAGAGAVTMRSEQGQTWMFPCPAPGGDVIAGDVGAVFLGTSSVSEEPLELALSSLASPIGDEDQETIQVVTDQLAAFLAAEKQRVLGERLTLDLQARERELARLVEAMIGAQEQERRRVAYDLHDGVAQSLAGLLYRLEAAGISIEDPRSARDALEVGIDIVRMSIAEVRGAIAALRPAELDDLGLEAALRARLEEIQAIELSFHSDFNGRRLPGAMEVTFYRVAQEAISNALKHSGCSRIDLRLGCDGAHFITLTVADNGRGIADFPVIKAAGRGVGMSAMRERMALIGGSISIGSGYGAGTGTVIVARAPVASQEREPA